MKKGSISLKIFVITKADVIFMNTKELKATPETLSAVRAEIRTLLASGDLPDGIRVTVQAGTYLPDAFVFTAEDCSPDCRVSYIAEQGAVISGGGIQFEKTSWQLPDAEMAERFYPEAREHIRMIDLSAIGLTADDWGVLTAIGAYATAYKYDDAPHGHGCECFCGKKDGDVRRMTIARYPNKGDFAYFWQVLDVGEPSGFNLIGFEDWNSRRNPRAGTYAIDGFSANRAAGWKKDADIWMFGYFFYDWADASTPVSFDCKHQLVFPRFVGMFGAKAGAPYYFYNIPEELDFPDEWYLDRKTGKLYFYPQENDDILEFSYIDKPLITCTGTVNMTFSGFTLHCAMQDAVSSTGDGMTFSDLNITNVDGNAIVCTGSRCLVSGCDISHTGRGGILMTGGDRQTLTPSHNRVTENYIHDISEIHLTYQPGISVGGVGALCDHNEICNSPHMALGYGGNDIIIEYNYIHDVVLQSRDAGAIYAGRDWAANGDIIRYNRISHIGTPDFHPQGIYWDDGLSGQSAYGNLITDVFDNGFLIGGGRENHVEGNVIMNCGKPILFDDRNRDGFLHHGWAHAACDTPDGMMWVGLNAMPIHSPVWAEKYPLLDRVVTDFSDPENPDFPINPAYGTVRGNVIIDADGEFGWCAQSVYDYSTVADNPVFRSASEAGWDEESGSFAKGSPVYDTLPAFAPIPVSSIGRTEKKNGCR